MNRGSKRWNCAELDQQGKKCGNTTQVWYDGRPMCRVHRLKAMGAEIPGAFKKPGQIIIKRDPLDVMEETLPFVKDVGEKIRLSEAILAERRKREVGCPSCRTRLDEERIAHDEHQFIVRRLTPEQHLQIARLRRTIWEVLDQAKSQPVSSHSGDTADAITRADGEVIVVDPNRSLYVPTTVLPKTTPVSLSSDTADDPWFDLDDPSTYPPRKS